MTIPASRACRPTTGVRSLIMAISGLSFVVVLALIGLLLHFVG